MRLAIVGSRSFKDFSFLEEKILELYDIQEIEEIVSGGAIGADSLAEELATKLQIPFKVFYPKWSQFGRGAGFKRNQEIVDYADEGVCFWDGFSKGSLDTVNRFKKAEKKIKIILVT